MEINMKIAVLDKCTVTNGDVSLAALEEIGEVKYFDTVAPEQIPGAIGDSEAVIVNKAKITSEIMDACPSLRFVGLFAMGYNNIDVTAARERGIAVCNVPGYSTESVAQLAFAFILHFATSIGKYSESTSRGDWANSETFSYLSYPITELAGKTLGIFGLGDIGKAVARIGRAFGMDIIATSRRKMYVEGVEFVTKEELFRRSDYLSLHCPLTDQTRGLVNRETLALMKPTAVLINTSRGGVVEEEPLREALNSGKLRGAGIDVLDVEPMTKGHPYLDTKNIIITPHVAWGSLEARTRLIGMVAENLRAFERGEILNRVEL